MYIFLLVLGGGQAVQAGLSCPSPTQVKIYVCYFVIFLYTSKYHQSMYTFTTVIKAIT